MCGSGGDSTTGSEFTGLFVKPPGRPVHTVNGIYLVHGDDNKFEMIFMSPQISQVPAWDYSLPAFLAEHDIDVWGMDEDWALVPPGTTDFSFFKNWGLQREVNNV